MPSIPGIPRIYLISGIARPAAVARAILERGEWDSILLPTGDWLIGTVMPMAQVKRHLGVYERGSGRILIVHVAEISGIQPREVTEWVRRRQSEIADIQRQHDEAMAEWGARLKREGLDGHRR